MVGRLLPWLLGLLPLLAWARPDPFPEEVLLACLGVLRGLEVQAVYQEGEWRYLVLGQEKPYLVLALRGGRLHPPPGPLRGRRVAWRPGALGLSLARWVHRGPGGYRCFLLQGGRVVGVLRLDPDLKPLPLPQELP